MLPIPLSPQPLKIPLFTVFSSIFPCSNAGSQVQHFNHKVETSKCWCNLVFYFLPTAATDSGFEHGLCQFQQHCTENCSVVFEPLIAARNTPRWIKCLQPRNHIGHKATRKRATNQPVRAINEGFANRKNKSMARRENPPVDVTRDGKTFPKTFSAVLLPPLSIQRFRCFHQSIVGHPQGICSL